MPVFYFVVQAHSGLEKCCSTQWLPYYLKLLSGLKLTKIENPRVYNVEMSVSTISSDEKTGQLHAKVEIGSLSYTIHKISSKCIKDLNVRPKAINFLEEM